MEAFFAWLSKIEFDRLIFDVTNQCFATLPAYKLYLFLVSCQYFVISVELRVDLTVYNFSPKSEFQLE